MIDEDAKRMLRLGYALINKGCKEVEICDGCPFYQGYHPNSDVVESCYFIAGYRATPDAWSKEHIMLKEMGR